MSKRIRDKGRNQVGDELRIEGGGESVAVAPGPIRNETEEMTSPRRFMMIIWGIPLLLLIAALLIQKLR
ncbi:MAG: hypothetical protein RBU30_03210 [Polyangia bacterium]|nr:hypothetical protein [Polyangia bacterium]